MGLTHPHSSINYATEFQISAIPWLTSSTVPAGSTSEYTFPCVTKWLTVKNNTAGSVAAVGVTLNGVEKTSNFFYLIAGESVSLDWRVVRMFVSSSSGSPNVSVIAGLTTIEKKYADALFHLSSSYGQSGVG